MRWLSFNLIFFFLCIVPAQAASWQEVISTASQSVVTVISRQINVEYLSEEDLPKGIGSGWIVDKSGYILAPATLVRRAKWIEVVLPDGRHSGATLVGIDYFSEVALLKLKIRARLKPLTFSAFPLSVGQEVALIGRPRWRPASIIGRVVEVPCAIYHQGILVPDMIAVDISPQRVGEGPLINLRGEVVGLAINLPNFYYSGGLYIIPSGRLKRAYFMLKKGQEAAWPWLGIRGQTLTPSLAKVLKLPINHGVMVVDIYRGSPAARAGFRTGSRMLSVGNLIYKVGGDIITKIDGQPIRSEFDLVRKVFSKDPGEEIRIVYYRGKRKARVKLRLGKKIFIQP